MRTPLILAATLVIGAAGAGLAADGAAVFKKNCAACHGETGKADTPASKSMKVPALAGNAKVAGMSDADVVAALKSSDKHKSLVKKLGDEDLAAAAAQAKSLAATK